MTTVGVLGSAELHGEISRHESLREVLWGSDSPTDVIRMMAGEDHVDVLVVEASVVFLTPEICECAQRVRLIALARNDTAASWARSFPGMEVITDFEELTRRNAELLPETVDAPAGNTHSVIAVWGPVGSPGASTVAISLAAIAASRGLRVLLCDADTRGSSVAVALGLLDETPGFAAACRLAGRNELTEIEMERLSVHAGRGDAVFDVLTGLPRSSRWPEITPQKAQKVIECARSIYDLVLLDTGFGIENNEWIDEAPQRDGASREILRTADAVVAVGASDVVGLTRFIRALDDLSECVPNPVVVLNKVSRGEGSDATEAIQRFTDHTIRAILSKDSRGGLEDAYARALSAPKPWDALTRAIGVGVPQPAPPRWPWRR